MAAIPLLTPLTFVALLGLLALVVFVAWILNAPASLWVLLAAVVVLALWGGYSVLRNAPAANAGGGGGAGATQGQGQGTGQGTGQGQGQEQGQGGGGEQPPPANNQVPYNLPPQPQIGHPSLYLETGVPCLQGEQNVTCRPEAENTKRWTIQLLPGTVAIIGGFKVDGETSGVYKAQAAPGTLNTLVTDGFVAITKAEWGNAEFCFRVGQARGFKWAPFHVNDRGQPVFTEAQQRARIRPLQGWSGC